MVPFIGKTMQKQKKGILFWVDPVPQQVALNLTDIRCLHLHETKGRTTTHCLFRIRRLLSTLKTAQHDCLCFCLIILVSYYLIFLLVFFHFPIFKVGKIVHRKSEYKLHLKIGLYFWTKYT